MMIFIIVSLKLNFVKKLDLSLKRIYICTRIEKAPD